MELGQCQVELGELKMKNHEDLIGLLDELRSLNSAMASRGCFGREVNEITRRVGRCLGNPNFGVLHPI